MEYNKNYVVHQKRRNSELSLVVHNTSDHSISDFYLFLGKKLSNIKDYYLKDVYSDEKYAWYFVKWLDIAIKLCSHLSGYDKSYPDKINKNNASRFVEAKDVDFELNSKRNIFGIKSDIYKEVVMSTDFDLIARKTFYDIKAKNLLFKIITNYINVWLE